MKIALKTEKSFTVISDQGFVRDLKQIGKEWNGMIELRGPDGQCIILKRPSNILTSVFAEIFEDQSVECQVIEASPSVFEVIGVGQKAQP